jgi:coenzyme F420-dependent glucose-6-phosphate dehydrogenase
LSTVRFGYKASNEQFAPTELLKYAVIAEECGFDSVFVSDHLQPWRHTGGHAPFAMSWLGALGASTERITMGTSVLTPTFRYHPAIVAQAFATLGCLFPGRVVLGMGTGESMNEVPLGIEWPDGKERFARFREAVKLIRELWSGERVTFEGDYYRTDKATIYDRPEQMVPLYLAGSGPAATRFAGRQGDGYITTSGKDPSLYTDTLLPAVKEGAEKAGRSVRDLDLMIEVKVSFDHDHDAAMQETRFWAALGLRAEQKSGVEDPVEM